VVDWDVVVGNGCLKKDCSFSGKTPKAISFGKVQQTSPKNIWDFEDSGRYDIQVCLNMGKQNQTYNELSVFPSHQSDTARFWAGPMISQYRRLVMIWIRLGI
jgi:hypothetical protein